MIFRLLLAAVFLTASQLHAKETFSGQILYASDGDTLWVQADTGGRPRKLRLDGIDAPEICQTGGADSRAALLQRVLHKPVQVTLRRYDNYGRGLARIELQGSDLGAQMVQSGHAWSDRWRRDTGPYANEEAQARLSRLGLFANGQLELPRDFRKRHGPCPVASP